MKEKAVKKLLDEISGSIKEFESTLNKVECEDLDNYDKAKIRLSIIEKLENIVK